MKADRSPLAIACSSLALSASLPACTIDDTSEADAGGPLTLDASTTTDSQLDAAVTDTNPPDTRLADSGQSGDTDHSDPADTSSPPTDTSEHTDTVAADASSDVAASEDVARPDTRMDPANCQFQPDPGLAAGEPTDMSGMVAAHNKWRVRVGVDRISWNTDLAASAGEYAQRCVWEHSDNRSPDGGFSTVGENLAFTTRQLSAFGGEHSVDLWAEERQYWDFGMSIGDGTFGDYGHYTQVTWASTDEVGCGAAYCSNVAGLGRSGTVIVCRYGPSGNYIGGAPYEETTGACLDLDNDDVRQPDDADDTDRTVQ